MAGAQYLPKLDRKIAANSSLAIVAPYDTATSGTANFGGAAGNTSREYLTAGKIYRIRQNGTIKQVKVYFANLTSLTAVYVKIWRKEGANYDLKATSNNILSGLTAGQINTVTLSTTMDAQEGDFYGYRLEWSDGVQNLYAKTGIANTTTYNVVNTTPSTTGYNWEGQTANAGYAVPIELYMVPPIFVAIGDSFIGGNPEHSSFIDNGYTVVSHDKHLAKHLGILWNYSYQNMGIGAEDITARATRFTADVVNLNPYFAVIQGGTADIFNGVTTKAQFLASWVTMLDACVDNDIVPIVILMPPTTNNTNAEHAIREDWNSALKNLVGCTYPSAVLIDTETTLGLERAGGDAGNLWDLKAAYVDDTIHPNATGKRYFAECIRDNVLKWRGAP